MNQPPMSRPYRLYKQAARASLGAHWLIDRIEQQRDGQWVIIFQNVEA